MHAQDTIGGGSPTSEAASEAVEPHLSGCHKKGSHEATCSRDHLPHIKQSVGYLQIHIALADEHKTTFTYPFDTFSYTRMSFGLCNAPSTL
ncbi:hypothetical protein CR513_12263, partial [Mucuna pruriens]